MTTTQTRLAIIARAKEASALNGRLPWQHFARQQLGPRWLKPWNSPYRDSRGQTWRWLDSDVGLRIATENATASVNKGASRVNAYYVTDEPDETMHGLVLHLTGGRFLAAVSDPYNHRACRVLCRVFDDLDDAERTADHEAEKDAEEARQHDLVWHLGQRWQAERDQVREAHKRARGIRQAMRIVAEALAGAGDDCADGGDTLAALDLVLRRTRQDLKSAWRKMQETAEGIWSEHRLTFNDGAGREVLKCG